MALYRTSSGGGAPQETTLWSNIYSGQFDEQDVTLSDSIDNYDYIKVTFNSTYTSIRTNQRSVIYSVPEFKTMTGGNGEVYYRDSASSPSFSDDGGYYKQYIRIFYYIPSTGKIHFRPAFYITDKSTTVTRAIPLSIVGIKL